MGWQDAIVPVAKDLADLGFGILATEVSPSAARPRRPAPSDLYSLHARQGLGFRVLPASPSIR